METAISIKGVSKKYHLYDKPIDRLREIVSPSKKRYGRDFWALNEISLDIWKGETIGIVGRNGSGKSTLLQIICGILQPTLGSVSTTGKISALLELGTGFNTEFTGHENVYLNGALMGFRKEEIDERYQDIVEFADIGNFIEQPVKTYSSGMYVRLAFACAVNVDPEILVIDEALSVGDVFFQQKCFRKMGEFKERGKTMLLVSHDQSTIQKNCERALFLDKGRLVSIGESRDVINNYLETILLKGESVGKGEGVKSGGKGNSGRRHEAPQRTGDRCATRPYYNKNEFRYGNLKASIVDFNILDEDGREVFVVSSGEMLRFRFEVLFDSQVEFPIYGLIIKTKDGLTAYGSNSWHQNVEVEPKGHGDRVVVEFRQNVNLSSGDYFVSVGVAELSNDAAVPVDRRYDMAYLSVLPVDRSFGVANLFSMIEIKNQSG